MPRSVVLVCLAHCTHQCLVWQGDRPSRHHLSNCDANYQPARDDRSHSDSVMSQDKEEQLDALQLREGEVEGLLAHAVE